MAATSFKITSEAEALAILAELKKLSEVMPASFVDDNFPKQAAFIRDPAKRKAALCTRRAGKSYGIGLALWNAVYEEPGCSALYIGLTRASAKNAMWKDILKVQDSKFKLGCKFNESVLTVTTPQGAVIYLAGADAGPQEMEKFLGGKYKIVVIDEAGSFRQDIRKLAYENLEPALADYDGSLVLIGTPTPITNSLFFDVTTGHPREANKNWSVHRWNTFDNPYGEVWQRRYHEAIAADPNIVETPGFKRMWLGEWVTDLGDLVYKYDEQRNYLPDLPAGSYSYVLGVDLGFDDATAFVVSAYSATDRNLYFVDSYKKSGMIISDVVERIRYLESRYPFQRMVVDGANKQAVEEMKQRYGLPLVAADKQGKAEFIEIMNSEFILGRIKLCRGADSLADEYGQLIWDKDSKKREEHASCQNHAADAALYNWRHCYQYLSQPIVKVSRTVDMEVSEWEQRESERVERRATLAFWERD